MKSVQVAVCGLYGYSRRLSRFEPAKDWNNSSTAALFQTQNYSSVEHEMTGFWSSGEKSFGYNASRTFATTLEIYGDWGRIFR